jgi:ABC-2 type transport system ATP-binding protein
MTTLHAASSVDGPVIEVRGLRKNFGDFAAVRGLDLTVERGEVLAILGPNGAGKTTTVEILEGYQDRDAGDVRVLGLDPAGSPRALRERIGIVLQECGIDRFLTCREVLAQHARFYRDPRNPDELLDLVGLTEKAGERVKRLSGGQQRRLDLALGMVGNPELLFLDEPTTGFDPQARRQAWDIVKRLAGDGTTVVLTTHYLDEAQALADRVVVFSRGQVVETGTPAELAARSGLVQITYKPQTGQPLPAFAADARTVDGVWRHDVAERAVTSFLAELTGWAIGNAVDLAALTVTRPSLEDTYLELIGDDASTEATDA